MQFLVIYVFFLNVQSKDLTCDLSLCPDIIKGDHRCHPECMSSSCNYDTNFELDGTVLKESSDCYGYCVSHDGCNPENLGNGSCDESCNTENCGFDWGDCLCAPGCLNSMMGDGNCDEECNSWDCDLDNHDCGACASECFPIMLGNGVCDPECNNEDCLYDYNDCQCAENCLWTDYGACKPECMVASCNFDKVDQYPDNWCSNSSLAIFSSYQQIIRGDFSYVTHLEDCYLASNFNCTLEKAFSLSECYNECNIIECNYANGNCNTETPDDLFCERSYKYSGGCISCKKYYHSILSNGVCIKISGYFYPFRFPDNAYVYYTQVDKSSKENPHIYFIWPIGNSGPEWGYGTIYTPWETITALSRVQYKYITVYLLESDNYFARVFPIPGTSGIGGYRSFNTKIIFNSFSMKYVKITTLNSTITYHRAFDDRSDSTFLFYLENVKNLEISNVIFDWKNTVSNCNDENYCDYCPFAIYDSASGMHYNDRGENLTDFLSSKWCQNDNNKNFFHLVNSNLALTNVTFINFRSGFNSIIYAENGNVTLNNVTFDNIKVYDGDSSGVIIWNGTNNSSYNSGSLKFENGIVNRLNNGYELKDTINTKGFLHAINITSALFRNVDFRNNVMLRESVTGLNSASMLFLNLFQALWIDSCSFVYNYCDLGIINLQQQYNYFSLETNDLKEIIYSTLNHVHIKNSSFISNYGKKAGILYAKYDYESKNFLIENSSFIMNGIENGPLIYIESNNADESFSKDNIISLAQADGEFIDTVYLAKWAKFFNLTLLENYSGKAGLIEITKMINLELKNININSNGLILAEDVNINTILLNHYIDDPDMYIKLNFTNPPDLDCEYLSSISDSINLNIKNANILKNNCKSSSPSIIISNTTNTNINSSLFAENTGSGSTSVCLTILGDSLTFIANSKFNANKNSHSGSPGALSCSSNLLLQNCLFVDNSGDSGGAICFTGQNLTILSSEFTSNKSPNLSGGAIYFLVSLNAVEALLLSITDSTFSNNFCSANGGGIFIHRNTPLEPILSIFISNANFSNNEALDGSCVYVDNDITLSSDSLMFNCNFEENKANFAGAFSAFYKYGVFSFSQCKFLKNVGLYGSAIDISIGEDNEKKSSKIILNSCLFQYNSGMATISIDDSNANSTLESNDCLFEYNVGSVFLIDSDYIADKNSIIQHNTSPISGGAFNLKNFAIFKSENTTYFNCSSNLNGGVASISLESQFHCFYCKFIKNNAGSSGGVIYADSNAQFFIVSSDLTQNSCQNIGSAIFMASTLVGSLVYESDISDNYSYNEGTISLSSSSISIFSTKISKNSCGGEGTGIELEDSNATIMDTTFSDQKGVQGSFILMGASNVKITNTSFSNGFSINSGAAIYAISSSLEIINSTFSDLYTSIYGGGAIYLYEESSMHLENSSFINLNSAIDLSSSFINISDSSFKNYSSVAIFATQTDLLVARSKFSDGLGINGGAIYCLQCNNISIVSSLLMNNLAENGGAIYVENEADHLASSQCNIISSSFISNRAGNGGAICTKNINLHISESEFIGNNARSWKTETLQDIIDGIGGAIKMKCEDTKISCKFDISSNNFINNSAVYNGGAINWEDSKPLFLNNTFRNNSAKYGADIASFPVMMIFFNNTKSRFLDTQSFSENSTSLTLNDVASGQKDNPPLAFALVDDIYQIITTDIKSQAQLQPTNNDAIISGTSIAYSKNGIYYFDKYIISSKPGSSTHISLVSSAIASSNISAFSIYVNLRLCEIGEATVGLSCEKCPKSYYNIDAENSKCLDCPSSAICYGNYTMVPKPGHWRDNKFTDHFWKCPYSSACLGSPNLSNISFTGTCKKGYENNMCHSCGHGYSRLYKNECQACPHLVSNIFRWFGIFIFLIFIALAILKTTRNSALRPSSVSSIYIKIFWNYLQIMIIIATFNLNWPSQAIQFFYIQTCLDYIGAQLFSFDCFLQSSIPKHKVYYDKILITSITPLAIKLASFFLWLIIYKVSKKRIKEIWDDYISTCVVLLFLIHPTIIGTMFSVYSCKEINPGEYWLNADLGIRCWDHDHVFYAFSIALPTIFIWLIILPAICLVNLIKNKNVLNEVPFRMRYGFLCNGYRSKLYYWEFLVLYYKVILIGCAVFLSNISINIQAITVAILLALFLHLQAKNQPFIEDFLNKTETFSRIVLLTTILAGLFFLTDDLDTLSTILILFVLLISNILFILYIFLKLLRQLSFANKIIAVLSRILHFRKERKYVYIEKEQIISDENNHDYKIVPFQSSKFSSTVIFGDSSNIDLSKEINKNASMSLEIAPHNSEQSESSDN